MEKHPLSELEHKYQENRRLFKSFITRTEKVISDERLPHVRSVEQQVWREVDCLACSNCCRVMTPTFTKEDVERIAAFLGMTPTQFKKKWLRFDRESGDWMNRSQPCQFLNLETNMCGIYEVRPADCAGFPHLSKAPLADYFYIHKQNIRYCPATYAFIEKLRQKKDVPSQWTDEISGEL